MGDHIRPLPLHMFCSKILKIQAVSSHLFWQKVYIPGQGNKGKAFWFTRKSVLHRGVRQALSSLMHHKSNHSKYFEVRMVCYFDRLVFRVLRSQVHLRIHIPQPFKREPVTQPGDDDLLVRGCHRAIYDNQIAAVDTRAGHGITRHPHIVGRKRMWRDQFVQVKRSLLEIVSR